LTISAIGEKKCRWPRRVRRREGPCWNTIQTMEPYRKGVLPARGRKMEGGSKPGLSANGKVGDCYQKTAHTKKGESTLPGEGKKLSEEKGEDTWVAKPETLWFLHQKNVGGKVGSCMPLRSPEKVIGEGGKNRVYC